MLKKKLLIFVIIMSLLVVGLANLFLWTDHKSQEICHWEYQSQYAHLRITAVGDSSDALQGVDELIPWMQEFTNTYKSGGVLDKKVYSAKVGDSLFLDSISFHLFAFALDFRNYSKGDIDVGIGSLLKVWKKVWRENAPMPDSLTIANYVQNLQTPFYSVDSNTNAIIIKKGKQHFALGAFMEGVLLNKMEAVLKQNGVESWLVEVSGDFAYRGKKPNGEPWRLAIKDPLNQGQLLAVVNTLPDHGSLCTSGDYEQARTVIDSVSKKKTIIHHIIDPKTGYPTKGKHSVTVSTSLPEMNKNALCTWFMVLPLVEIQKVVEDSKGKIEVFVVIDSVTTWISPRMQMNLDMLN